jgi:4-diphosphocytidyl-2-C-methyl-D-erythritol kinase
LTIGNLRTNELKEKPFSRNSQSLIKNRQFLAPAKLNIRLKVKGRRADGYHELVSIMVPVGLFDHLGVALIHPGRIMLSSQGISVPDNGENLVYRAAQAYLSKTGLSQGVSIELKKNIPVAAGLGGGSSDAASTLKTLNEMCSNPLTFRELSDLAIDLGADVPFFLHNRPCIVRGIGEVVEPLEEWPRFWYVIVMPPIEVSTAWVYRNLKLKLTREKQDYTIKSLKKGRFEIIHVLENDLEAVTGSHFPVIDKIKRCLVDAGAEGALMSGSGPSVFGVFKTKDKALLAQRHLLSKDLGKIFVVEGLS